MDESKAGPAISPPFDKRGWAGNPTVTQWERFPTGRAPASWPLSFGATAGFTSGQQVARGRASVQSEA